MNGHPAEVWMKLPRGYRVFLQIFWLRIFVDQSVRKYRGGDR
jgi:hypothetical protein